jgi:DNA sulfur modification protein DndD
MLIREITIENFLTLHGKQAIAFPRVKGPSVSVFLGPNNSGKSSFVKALQFLLHRRLPGCDGDEGLAWRLVNNRHKQEATVGKALHCRVTATFAYGDAELTIRRSVETTRTGPANTAFAPATVLFSYLQKTSTSSKFVADDTGVIQRKISQLCPDTLLEAFFFSGEPLNGRLLGGVKNVRESLEEYLSIRDWKQAADSARAISNSYTREMTSFASDSKELEQIITQEGRAQEKINQLKVEQNKTKEQLEETRQALEDKQIAILGIANQTELREVVNKRNDLNQDLEACRKNAQLALSSICEAVGSSLGLPLLLPFTNKAQDILKHLTDENILPADLSSGFVDRVLRQQNCICGTKHTEETKSAWQAYLQKTLKADVGTKLASLGARLNPDAPNCIQDACKEIATQLESAIYSAEKANSDEYEMKVKLAELDEKIQSSPTEELSRLERERRALDKQCKGYDEQLKRIADDLRIAESEMRRKKLERDKIAVPKDIQRKIEQLETRRKMAANLADLIDQSIAVLRHQFQEGLQQTMQDLYTDVVTDRTQATIDPRSLLPHVVKDGKTETNLGGGQSQLLGLAYIVAIAKLRSALHKQMGDFGIRLGVIGQQSFVLDCPFSGMTERYASAAIEALCRAAEQAVFLLHREQWDLARPHLERKAAKAWGVRLYAPDDAIKSGGGKLEDHIFDYKGRKESLLSPLPPNANEVFSEIVQLS